MPLGLREPRPRKVVLQLQLPRRQVRSRRLDGHPRSPVAVSPRPPPATGALRSRSSPSPPPLPFQRFESSPVFSIESSKSKRTFFVFARFSVVFDGSPLSARFERLPGLPVFRTAARLRGARRPTGVAPSFPADARSPSVPGRRARHCRVAGVGRPRALPNRAIQTPINCGTPCQAEFWTVPAGQALKDGVDDEANKAGSAVAVLDEGGGVQSARTGEVDRSGRGPSFFFRIALECFKTPLFSSVG